MLSPNLQLTQRFKLNLKFIKVCILASALRVSCNFRPRFPLQKKWPINVILHLVIFHPPVTFQPTTFPAMTFHHFIVGGCKVGGKTNFPKLISQT